MASTAVRVRHPHVTVHKGYCGGSPVIAGTKLAVRSIVTYVLRQGMTAETVGPARAARFATILGHSPESFVGPGGNGSLTIVFA